MRAIVQEVYGDPDVLHLAEVERPEPGPGEVLIRVLAASVHPGDWMQVRGAPLAVIRPVFGLRRPKRPTPGYDVSGVVEAVGPDVSRFVVGDEVFGKAETGACAEFAVCSDDAIVSKPSRLTFEQAGALSVSGCTALRGMRDAAKVEPGQTVLINGASGGIGTYAVQMATAMGAEVTGVSSGRNADLVRSLGAVDVIDYSREDFTDGDRTWDVVFDNVGNHSLRRLRRAVAKGGTSIPNNGTAGGRWFGPLGRIIRAAVGSMVIPKQGRPFVSIEDAETLEAVSTFVEAGDVTPVIAATYSLEDTAKAFEHVATGHAAGKVVIVP